MDNKEKNKELEKKFLCKDKFWSKGYAVRNIDFMNDFNDETARQFIMQVRAYSKLIAEDPELDTDIYLYVNSCGGYVTSLLAIIDAMNLVPNDFATICIGQCASCGAVLLSAGTKGKRYITENARVLIHQVSGVAIGKNSEMQADAKETDRLNDLLLSMLAKNCGKTVDEIKELTLGGDLILNAEQAVEFGIVDAILTQDVIARLNSGEDMYLLGNAEEQEQETDKCKPKEKKSNEDYEIASLKLEIKSIEDNGKYYSIKGVASTPDIDRVDDIVKPEALLDSVQRIGLPAFVHQHNLREMPLGVCVSVTQKDGDTIVDLKMPKDDYSDKIKSRAEMGAYQGLSIGYEAKETERNAEGYRIISKLDWYEVSLVTVPANPNAKLLQVKQRTHENKSCDIMQDIKTIRDVENLLISVGCTKKEAGYVISLCKSSKGEPEEEGEGEPSQDKVQDENIKALIELKNVLTGK